MSVTSIAPVTTVPTTDLCEGDIIYTYGIVLRLHRRRDLPSSYTGAPLAVEFVGEVLNMGTIDQDAAAGHALARMIQGSVRDVGLPHPVWMVDGTEQTQWGRIRQAPPRPAPPPPPRGRRRRLLAA